MDVEPVPGRWGRGVARSGEWNGLTITTRISSTITITMTNTMVGQNSSCRREWLPLEFVNESVLDA